MVLGVLHFIEVFCTFSFLFLQIFSSWVQTQLKNHPDELWEDGVRDYLAHASNIMVICYIIIYLEGYLVVFDALPSYFSIDVWKN